MIRFVYITYIHSMGCNSILCLVRGSSIFTFLKYLYFD